MNWKISGVKNGHVGTKTTAIAIYCLCQTLLFIVALNMSQKNKITKFPHAYFFQTLLSEINRDIK